MSAPLPSRPAAPPAPAPGRQRATLWAAPWQVPGPQLREAISSRLPWPQRLVLIGTTFVLGGAVGVLGGASDDPAVPVVGLAVVVPAVLVLLRVLLARKRRSYGMVQVTPRQLDLLVALGQLPAARIDSGRQLHDHFVWLAQQPSRDAAAVRECETWMEQLTAGP